MSDMPLCSADTPWYARDEACKTICPSTDLINDPSHIFNWVDVNCVPYTGLEMLFFAGGCLMWVMAYIILIKEARQYKFMEMAAFAGAGNFAWEAVWSWAYTTDTGWFMVWTYRAWFFLDIYIFYLLLKYGHKQVYTPWVREYFKPLCCAALVGWIVIYYLFIAQGYDMPIGANTAYIAQLTLSILCPIVLLNAKSMDGFSFHFAWLRSFGTAANTVFMFMHYPDNHFLHSLGVTAFILDMGYLLLFKKKEQAFKTQAIAAA